MIIICAGGGKKQLSLTNFSKIVKMCDNQVTARLIHDAKMADMWVFCSVVDVASTFYKMLISVLGRCVLFTRPVNP